MVLVNLFNEREKPPLPFHGCFLTASTQKQRVWVLLQPCCISTDLHEAPRVPVPHPSGGLLQNFTLPSNLKCPPQFPIAAVQNRVQLSISLTTLTLLPYIYGPPVSLSPALAVTEGHSLGPSEGRGSRWFLRGRGRAHAALASYSWLCALVCGAVVLWLMPREYSFTKQDLGRRS